MASRRSSVGLVGCAPRLMSSRGHPALIPDTFGLYLRSRPARCACPPVASVSGVWAVLLFPSPYLGVLAVKGCAPLALAVVAVFAA
jgi:hypothetical protein